MQNDLQDGFNVLYLRYFHCTFVYNMQLFYLKRLIGKSKRGGCARESVEITNKPFFMLIRNASMEGY